MPTATTPRVIAETVVEFRPDGSVPSCLPTTGSSQLTNEEPMLNRNPAKTEPRASRIIGRGMLAGDSGGGGAWRLGPGGQRLSAAKGMSPLGRLDNRGRAAPN